MTSFMHLQEDLVVESSATSGACELFLDHMTLAVGVQLKPGVEGLAAFDAHILSVVTVVVRAGGGHLLRDQLPGRAHASL